MGRRIAPRAFSLFLLAVTRTAALLPGSVSQRVIRGALAQSVVQKWSPRRPLHRRDIDAGRRRLEDLRALAIDDRLSWKSKVSLARFRSHSCARAEKTRRLCDFAQFGLTRPAFQKQRMCHL